MLPELFWLESLIHFERLSVYGLCGDVLAILESFLVRVVVFSITLFMYLSHADRVSITDPRTLKLSTKNVYLCNIFAFQYNYGAFSVGFLLL